MCGYSLAISGHTPPLEGQQEKNNNELIPFNSALKELSQVQTGYLKITGIQAMSDH